MFVIGLGFASIAFIIYPRSRLCACSTLLRIHSNIDGLHYILHTVAYHLEIFSGLNWFERVIFQACLRAENFASCFAFYFSYFQ